MSFSLEEFEDLVYRREHEYGLRAIFGLLNELDQNYGFAGKDFSPVGLQALSGVYADEHIWTRIASATTTLLSDPTLQVATEWSTRFLALHRWLGALFSATPFVNADHILRRFRTGKGNELSVPLHGLLIFCLLYSAESEIPLDLDALWKVAPELVVGLCIGLLAARFVASPAAHKKREIILPWLRERLALVDDLELLPSGVMHDVYMHCSYADGEDKHSIKIPINQIIRKRLIAAGLSDIVLDGYSLDLDKEKPVLLVVLEWFTKGHSIYRTHSRTLEAARDRFYVVAMAYEGCIDHVTRMVFDEVVLIRSKSVLEQMEEIRAEALRRGAAILYMPSVGMFPLTMWLSNLRVAPLQVMALGHPATTYSDKIDYVVVEEDYVGDPGCFSEKLIQLPCDGMPYRPSADGLNLDVRAVPRLEPEVVRIAVCATVMKLNPRFLETCSKIVQRASTAVEFHFLIGQAQGLIYPNVQRVLRQYLGSSAIVYRHQPYDQYMRTIAKCDMFINPFPFGNTNGIIDTVSAGLVGVCLTGREVHEHIDEGIFGRLNFPKWLVASTLDDFVTSTLRLVENHKERCELMTTCASIGAVNVMFEGRPAIMAERFSNLLAS